jgi:hypothetical protein
VKNSSLHMEHKRTSHSVLGGFTGFHPCDLELLVHKGGLRRAQTCDTSKAMPYPTPNSPRPPLNVDSKLDLERSKGCILVMWNPLNSSIVQDPVTHHSSSLILFTAKVKG